MCFYLIRTKYLKLWKQIFQYPCYEHELANAVGQVIGVLAELSPVILDILMVLGFSK